MSSESGLLDGLELFYGAASNNLARIYARVAANGAFHEPYQELSLSGFVRGPECEYSRTLPATSPLVAQAPGESLLAQAIVPDPCFWTPDVPSRYQVQVELRRGKAVIDTVERELAIRNFGPRGKSLFLEGKRWVLRGVHVEQCTPHAPREVDSDDPGGQPHKLPSRELANRPHAEREEYIDLTAWREARAAMIVASPSDELCRQATRLGVFLVALVGGTDDEIIAELRNLTRFGAVAVAIVQSREIPASVLRSAAPNLVLAQGIGGDSAILLGDRPNYFVYSGAEMAFVEMHDSERFAGRVNNCPYPVVAWRPIQKPISISEARAAIDDLQRDLAPYGDYAGYLV